MKREEALEIVRTARLKGGCPDLRGADLSRADLSWVNFRWADLRGADLSRASLRGADLREADLRGADLGRADIHWANLSGANLDAANLSMVVGGAFQVSGIPSGGVVLTPTPAGWRISIGCWRNKAISDLRALLDGPDANFPEPSTAAGRRTGLEALYALAVAHIEANPKLVSMLAERWSKA